MKTIRTYSNDTALIEERRHHIISCSITEFTKKGYHTTNIRQLAKACQTSIGTLYHYFGSKEDILYSIINNATFEQARIIEEYAAQVECLRPTEALRQLIIKLYRWHDENQDLTLFAYQETKNLPRDAQDNIFDSENRILAVFEKLIRKGIESREFDASDPKLLAHHIIILGHTWAVRRWLLRKYWSLDAYIEHVMGLVLKAVVKTIGESTKPEG